MLDGHLRRGACGGAHGEVDWLARLERCSHVRSDCALTTLLDRAENLREHARGLLGAMLVDQQAPRGSNGSSGEAISSRRQRAVAPAAYARARAGSAGSRRTCRRVAGADARRHDRRPRPRACDLVDASIDGDLAPRPRRPHRVVCAVDLGDTAARNRDAWQTPRSAILAASPHAPRRSCETCEQRRAAGREVRPLRNRHEFLAADRLPRDSTPPLSCPVRGRAKHGSNR